MRGMIAVGNHKQNKQINKILMVFHLRILLMIIKLTVMTMMINVTKIFVPKLQKGTKVRIIQSVWFNKETEQLIGH